MSKKRGPRGRESLRRPEQVSMFESRESATVARRLVQRKVSLAAQRCASMRAKLGLTAEAEPNEEQNQKIHEQNLNQEQNHVFLVLRFQEAPQAAIRGKRGVCPHFWGCLPPFDIV